MKELNPETEKLCADILQKAAEDPDILPAVLMTIAMAIGAISKSHSDVLSIVDGACKAFRRTATDCFVRTQKMRGSS